MEIGLAEAVAAVRGELLKAAEDAVGEDLVFEVGPVEMEFEVELRADAKAKAGFRVWAVAAETEAGVSRGRTHRVSFTLTPRTANGSSAAPLRISAPDEGPDGPGLVSERDED